MLALFFLLQPNKYVDTNSKTTSFSLQEVHLNIGDVYVDLPTAIDQQLLVATRITLMFTTQKNGV